MCLPLLWRRSRLPHVSIALSPSIVAPYRASRSYLPSPLSRSSLLPVFVSRTFSEGLACIAPSNTTGCACFTITGAFPAHGIVPSLSRPGRAFLSCQGARDCLKRQPPLLRRWSRLPSSRYSASHLPLWYAPSLVSRSHLPLAFYS